MKREVDIYKKGRSPIELYLHYKQMILYIVFGLLTTAVNMVSYWLVSYVFGAGIGVSTTIAWIAAVAFAYLTNRKWVFPSDAHTPKEIAREVASFFACRLATYFVDLIIMKVFAEKLGWDEMFVKFGANVVVIVLNYIASKLIIFKKKARPVGAE